MKGSYILVIFSGKGREIRIGALGNIFFSKGFYLYVGSGMGNTGASTLVNRVKRHILNHTEKRIHWHIDYLLNSKYTIVYCIYLIPSLQNIECLIANELLNISDGHIKKFGSSDCLCDSHLLYFKDFKSLKKLYQ
ncbi:MAG: GIY-YIG nuclease family protein [Candidatus Lokiarchaeia archaeon]